MYTLSSGNSSSMTWFRFQYNSDYLLYDLYSFKLTIFRRERSSDKFSAGLDKVSDKMRESNYPRIMGRLSWRFSFVAHDLKHIGCSAQN